MDSGWYERSLDPFGTRLLWKRTRASAGIEFEALIQSRMNRGQSEATWPRIHALLARALLRAQLVAGYTRAEHPLRNLGRVGSESGTLQTPPACFPGSFEAILVEMATLTPTEESTSARSLRRDFRNTFRHLAAALFAAVLSACADHLHQWSLFPVSVSKLVSVGVYASSWLVYSWQCSRKPQRLTSRLVSTTSQRRELATIVVHRAGESFGHTAMVAGLFIRTASYRIILTYFVIEYVATWAGFSVWISGPRYAPTTPNESSQETRLEKAPARQRVWRLLEFLNGPHALGVTHGWVLPFVLVTYCTFRATRVSPTVHSSSMMAELSAIGLWQPARMRIAEWLMFVAGAAHMLCICGNVLITTIYLATVEPDSRQSKKA